MTKLQDGDEVWGIVKLVAKVSGNDIAGVKFYYDAVDDNHLIGAAVPQSGSKHETDWYTQDLPNGQTTLYAVAYDSGGEFAQDIVNITIHNMTRADSIDRLVKNITIFQEYSVHSDWSPDGNKIVFERINKDLYFQLYIGNSDGTNIQSFTDNKTR